MLVRNFFEKSLISFIFSIVPLNSVKKDKETRKKQTCSLCQNHSLKSKKKGHKCDFDNKAHFELCEPCRMTKDRRFAASKDKKNNYQKKKNFGHILSTEPSFGKKRKDQMCRKCANHGVMQSMKDHKNACDFFNCSCNECIETEKRRFAVKHEAKAKRQKNKNQIKQENDESMSSCPPSPNDSGYNSDLSTASSKNHSSKYSLPSVINSSLFEPISYTENADLKCKDEKVFWNFNQTSSTPVSSISMKPFLNAGHSFKEENKFWEFDQSSNYSSSPIDSGFFEPIPYVEQSYFKCKEEKKFWEMDLLSNAKTTDFYTNTSSNTFQEIISVPIKTEASEVLIQNCTNLTADDNMFQAVVQGLINNEFNIEEIYYLSIDSN